MHEQSIVSSLLSMALDSAEVENARKIIRIRLVVGELTGVEEDAVKFYFGFLTENTIAAGAILEFQFTKPQLRCRDCDVIFPWDKQNYHCPSCGKKAIEIIGGRELYIDNMEIM